MLTVKEVSKLAGVSVRTLQHYDNIGLLKPAAHTESGYRLYDESSLERLQQILLFRELEFPLKDIQHILSSPDFDRSRALQQQIQLLELKKEHIENLIRLAQKIKEEGEHTMDFTAFDKQKIADYSRQAKQQWGMTEAYAQFQQKNQGRSEGTQEALGKGLMEIFVRMGQIRHKAPESPEAQALVRELQGYITEHYYRCTGQILLSLGQMYAAGDEFTGNIDAAGGEGTAVFGNESIKAYCRK